LANIIFDIPYIYMYTYAKFLMIVTFGSSKTFNQTIILQNLCRSYNDVHVEILFVQTPNYFIRQCLYIRQHSRTTWCALPHGRPTRSQRKSKATKSVLVIRVKSDDHEIIAHHISGWNRQRDEKSLHHYHHHQRCSPSLPIISVCQ